MALIGTILGAIFGNGRNVLRETAEVFRENSEEGAARDSALRQAAMAQFGAEFLLVRQGWFDRLMDGLNRLPRPMMALGTLGLFIAAMVDPVWFASRMQGIALVPEPLWWLLGAIVSFYFGARHQAKGQEFQVRVAETMSHVPQVVENLRALRALSATSPGAADAGPDAALTLDSVTPAPNPALEEWRALGPRRRTPVPPPDPITGR